MIYNGRPYPQELPLQIGDLDPHVTPDALGPCDRAGNGSMGHDGSWVKWVTKIGWVTWVMGN